MTGIIINGRAIADKILEKTTQKLAAIKTQGVDPELAVILVGDDKSSHSYVKKKEEAAKKIGLKFKLYKFNADITTDKLITEINKIQTNKNLAGLIAQLPLPHPVDTKKILNAINPDIDVDCLSDVNFKKIITHKNLIIPPTPGAILAILNELKISLTDKNITIIGLGALVGKPLAVLLKQTDAKITTCDSGTPNIPEKCRQADILITAVGKKDLVRGDMIKPGAIVIDAGVDFVDKKMYGDVNVAEALEKAAYVTPTPGGVGPITVAQLLLNTVVCAEKNLIKK